MKTLSDMVGERIAVLIPQLHPTIWKFVRLHAVEPGGIWIESQEVTDALLSSFGATMSPKTLVFFFPYHQILSAMGSADIPSIAGTLAT